MIFSSVLDTQTIDEQQVQSFFSRLTLEKLLYAAVLLVLCAVLIRLILRAADKLFSRSKLDHTIFGFLRTSAKAILIFITIMLVAGTLGVDTTSLLAILSVAGLAVSLSLQTALSNVAGAMMILTAKPFRAGDYVQIGDKAGTVLTIGAVYTSLRTYDGQRIYLPNSQVITGRNLLIRANMQEAMLHTVANTLKANNVAALPARAEAVMAENKAMSKELEDIKAKVAASKVTSLFDNAETVGDVKIASAYFTGTSGDTLRGMCDTIRDNAKAAAVAVLVGKSDDKITMAVTVTKDAQAKGLKAGNLVKEISAIAGGKGGGKPDFAMAGLKDETKIDEALAAVKSIVEKQLG